MVADRSDAGTARCSADSASMDPVQDSEAGLADRCADSASMDPVRYSVAERLSVLWIMPIRILSVILGMVLLVRLCRIWSLRNVSALCGFGSAAVFPDLYLYIQMNSDLRNLP